MRRLPGEEHPQLQADVIPAVGMADGTHVRGVYQPAAMVWAASMVAEVDCVLHVSLSSIRRPHVGIRFIRQADGLGMLGESAQPCTR